MEQQTALHLITQMLTLSAKIAAPFLITCLAVGLLISIIQVLTQVQEMTLTFVPKIIAGVVVIFIFGGWMLNELVSYAKIIITNAAFF